MKSQSQQQTEETFGFKWKKRETYESSAMQESLKSWLFEKYFDGDPSRVSDLFQSRSIILDAGCGSGCSGLLLFGDHLQHHDYLGVDISEAVNVAELRFAEKKISARFERCDLNSIPEHYGQFDVIFSEGVLHHTDSVENAIVELSKRLRVGGKFLFYVYKKKAPIREFTDDLIRDALTPLNNEEAWAALEPLSKLGKTLGVTG